MNLLLAFITGLTTGGLSCLAVQGGLLASSLAHQVEADLHAVGRRPQKGARAAQNPQLALPILAFLTAKLAAYTLLGLLLGWVGSMFQLSLGARAAFQIAIGVFMLGNALRMLNVHPIFRFFAFEPPAFLRRRVRKTARSESLAAPLFLGLLTVLIPCGVTQAVMAAALGTGSPLEGAALMFAFTLGTSPVFFTLAYFATRLGARLEKNFMRFVAVVLLVLGLVSVDSGLNLAGSPVSFSRWWSELTTQTVQAAAPGLAAPGAAAPELTEFDPQAAGPSAPEEALSAPGLAGENVVTVTVKNSGYFPGQVHARSGVPVQLRLVSKNVRSCALAFIIPALNYQKLLQSTGIELIQIPPQPKGTRMEYSCSMGMYVGEIIFD